MKKFNTKLTITLAALMLAGGALVGCKPKEVPVEEPTYYVVPASEEDQGYTIEGIKATGYKAGETVSFTITVDNPADKEVSKVRYKIAKEDFTVYQEDGLYSFPMPTNNVSLYALLRNVDKYNLQVEGEFKKGLFADVDLFMGMTPVISYSVRAATLEEVTKIRVLDKRVQFLVSGDVTIAAVVDNQIVATQKVTVTDTAKGESSLNPLTVEEAIEKCEALPKSTSADNKHRSEKKWYVGGVVTKIGENDDSYSNATLTLDGQFEAYRCYFDVNFDRSLIDLGSYVVVYAYLINYNGTPETDGDKSDQALFVAIDNSEVHYIDADPARSVQIGKNITLRADLKPAGATAGTVSYSVEDATVASVNSSGKVTGLKVGETTITIKHGENLSKEVKIAVVNDEVHGQTPDDPIDADAAAVICSTLPVTTSNDDRHPSDAFYYIEDYVTSVTENNYSFSNATCVLGEKFTIYRGSFGDGFDRENVCVGAKVTVRATLLQYNETSETDEAAFIGADASVAKGAFSFEKDRAGRLQVGESEFVNMYIQPKSGHFPGVFTSSDPTVASVSAKGKVTALKAGETTIKISYTVGADKFEATKKYIISTGAPAWPKGEHASNPFNVDEAIAKCEEIGQSGIDEEFYIKGYLTKMSGKKSSAFSGTMANEAGDRLFTLYNMPCSSSQSDEMSTGVTILFKCFLVNYKGETPENDGNRSSTGLLEIEHPDLTGVSLNKSEATTAVEREITLIASPAPEGALLGNATWTSSNEAIATVKAGVVTGVGEGDATITVASGEFHASCTIHVLAKGTKIEVEYEIPATLFPRAAQSECSADIEAAGLTITISGGGLNSANSCIAIYKNKTITIALGEGSEKIIKKVEFKAAGDSDKKCDGLAEQDGLTITDEVATWVGSDTTVTFTASGHQIQVSIIVTLYE